MWYSFYKINSNSTVFHYNRYNINKLNLIDVKITNKTKTNKQVNISILILETKTDKYKTGSRKSEHEINGKTHWNYLMNHEKH